jgi:hypothetical protein
MKIQTRKMMISFIILMHLNKYLRKYYLLIINVNCDIYENIM